MTKNYFWRILCLSAFRSRRHGFFYSGHLASRWTVWSRSIRPSVFISFSWSPSQSSVL